jgi:hypothetical protein
MITIEDAMRMVHMSDRGHNRVMCQHTRHALQYMIENLPLPEPILIARLRLVMGMQKRYVLEYLDSFYAFGLIAEVEGVVQFEFEEEDLCPTIVVPS